MVESAAIRMMIRTPPPSKTTPSEWPLVLTLSFFQVTSLTPRSSPSTPSPRCTSSCSTACLVPFTARSFGTFVPGGGQLCLVECHGGQWACLCTPPTQAAEKNLGGIHLHHTTTYLPPTEQQSADRVQYSVRSRVGRRNRAPPPRVRYNKDGKKITPTQGAKVAGGSN